MKKVWKNSAESNCSSYGQFFNTHHHDMGNADDRPEFHKNGELDRVGPPVDFGEGARMRKSSIEIIAWREASSMVSNWREYLCLSGGSVGFHKLFTGRYEALDEVCKYYDEEADDYVLPATINNKIVVGVEDEAVVGGDLNYYEDADHIDFDSLDDAHLREWLAVQGWTNEIGEIEKRLKSKGREK